MFTFQELLWFVTWISSIFMITWDWIGLATAYKLNVCDFYNSTVFHSGMFAVTVLTT